MKQLETMRILSRDELYQAHASRLREAGASNVNRKGCTIAGKEVHWTWAIDGAALAFMCDCSLEKAFSVLAPDGGLEKEHVIEPRDTRAEAYMRREWMRFVREAAR